MGRLMQTTLYAVRVLFARARCAASRFAAFWHSHVTAGGMAMPDPAGIIARLFTRALMPRTALARIAARDTLLPMPQRHAVPGVMIKTAGAFAMVADVRPSACVTRMAGQRP